MKNTRALLAAMALIVAVAACGGSDGSDETTAATTASTAATTASTAAPATSAATTTAPATTTGGSDTTTTPSGDGIEINVITDGIAFSVDEITVAAGQEVTIIVQDKDTGSDEPHNFHVRAGAQNFFTNIQEAPNTQTLTFTIDTPGVYEFFCDTHLADMSGVFIVEG